jgi:hypothetical protein
MSLEEEFFNLKLKPDLTISRGEIEKDIEEYELVQTDNSFKGFDFNLNSPSSLISSSNSLNILNNSENIIKEDEKIKNEKEELKIIDTPLNIEELNFLNYNSKTLSRTFKQKFSTEPISVSTYRFNYVIGHLTQADLSMLKDFDKFKNNLDLVNNSFITLGKPFDYENYKVIIRDTMLLSPASRKSLAALGDLYNLPKIKLSYEEISNMDKFLIENKEKFDEYAIRDSLITLIHSLSMENFSFSINENTIPLTLSSLGQKFVKNYWKTKSDYAGYQPNPLYNLGDVSSTITPKGLSNINIGLKIPYYIANYKGGRNESFMYGCDSSETIWYDYDLVSAYTTALALVGHPKYDQGSRLRREDLKKLSDEEIIHSYTIIKCGFKFPPKVKYPSIPCYIDEISSVYPLQGECVITGPEYILARNQGCEFTMSDIFRIPFDNDIKKPFFDIFKEIQKKRRDNPKGSFLNLLYKEIGNSIYGSIVRGMGNVKRYDAKTGLMKRMTSTELSNPLLAS